MQYSIDEVVALTGLSAFTLRNWEKRFGFPKPGRQENRYRVYSPEDVALLKRVAALTSQGSKISEIAALIHEGSPLPEPPDERLSAELKEQVDAVYRSLLELDTERADSLLFLLSSRHSAARMLESVYRPMLVRFGEDWSVGKISVAQEHFCSAFVRMKVLPYLNLQPTFPPTKARHALCATLEGEFHEGGLLLLAAHLRLRGWRLHYFGAALPIDELFVIARSLKPSVVCLSFSDADSLRAALPRIAALAPLEVCIGGYATLAFKPDESLSTNVHLFRVGGQEAVDLLELIGE